MTHSPLSAKRCSESLCSQYFSLEADAETGRAGDRLHYTFCTFYPDLGIIKSSTLFCLLFGLLLGRFVSDIFHEAFRVKRTTERICFVRTYCGNDKRRENVTLVPTD